MGGGEGNCAGIECGRRENGGVEFDKDTIRPGVNVAVQNSHLHRTEGLIGE